MRRERWVEAEVEEAGEPGTVKRHGRRDGGGPGGDGSGCPPPPTPWPVHALGCRARECRGTAVECSGGAGSAGGGSAAGDGRRRKRGPCRSCLARCPCPDHGRM